MPTALERGDQIVEIVLRIGRAGDLPDNIPDGLLTDQQGRAHFGSYRARGVDKGDRTAKRQAGEQRGEHKSDQTKPQWHGRGPARRVDSCLRRMPWRFPDSYPAPSAAANNDREVFPKRSGSAAIAATLVLCPNKSQEAKNIGEQSPCSGR